jgi:hypothetical protein
MEVGRMQAMALPPPWLVSAEARLASESNT